MVVVAPRRLPARRSVAAPAERPAVLGALMLAFVVAGVLGAAATQDAADAGPRPDADAPAAPLVAGGRARVANTDRLGVIIHDAPRHGARTPRGYLQDAAVVVLERSGADWARVRGERGLEGWVPTAYLVPAE